jgi:hypothetical protein
MPIGVGSEKCSLGRSARRTVGSSRGACNASLRALRTAPTIARRSLRVSAFANVDPRQREDPTDGLANVMAAVVDLDAR